MIIDSVLSAIGNVPLIRLKKISSGNIFAKAKHIIESAEGENILKEGMTIIEATSGNTGIGLTLVGVLKGYKVISIMPENVSEERKKLIYALGGEIILTPPEDSVSGSLSKLKELTEAQPEVYFIANQFQNPRNPETHYTQTAPEIWHDMDGKIDVFVAGVGSGGSLQGIGSFIKERNPNAKLVAVEPKNSAALLGREPGLHQIQGIGDGFVPDVLDVNLIDMVFTVSDEEAIETTRKLSLLEGLLVGTSSGANVFAAINMDNGTNRVVTILPDRAERYFSTSLL